MPLERYEKQYQFNFLSVIVKIQQIDSELVTRLAPKKDEVKERTEFAQKSVVSLVQKTLPTVKEKDEKSLLLNPLLWLFSLATLLSGKPLQISIFTSTSGFKQNVHNF